MEDIQKTLEFAARFAADKGLTKYTRFLDPAQTAMAVKTARENGAAFSSWGGYDRAERAVGCFCPWGEEPSQASFPLVCLHTAFRTKFCSLSHRDLLGAFMALGLTRDCIGDIIIAEDDIYLFVSAQTADFVVQSMTSAGKTPLHWQVLEGPVPIPEPKGTAFHDTVSSLRLDAVLAGAYRLSRSEASELIRAGLVKLNHIPCERVDAPVEEGAMLSVRAKGRVLLKKIDGMTRKQRIGLTFFRYE